mmetsp:Transcript_14462/g.18897  ORF Transcript_14462/g.18897 Transcript_14462/m.18897 type:complete len:518 (-) Transcript_14462:217-1770(-)
MLSKITFKRKSLLKNDSKGKNSSDSESKENDNLRKWVRIPQVGDIPGKRSGHAVVALGDKAYLFGGCGETNNFSDAFYSFNLSSHCWKKLLPGPCARASFELALGADDGTIIMAGGTSKDGLQGSMYEFNIYTRQWRQIVFEVGEDIAMDFLTSYGQTVRAYEKSLIGFGGSKGTSYSNKVVKMNLKLLKCEELQTSGPVPSCRYKHAALIVEDQMFIVGGGSYRPDTEFIDVYALGLHTLKWTRFDPTGSPPAGRAAHTCVYDDFARSMYVWGGFNEALERINDFHCLNLDTMTWSPIRCNSGSPPARAFHSAALHDSTLYIFGGADGETRFEDVWKYTFRQSPPSLMVLAARTPTISLMATPVATPLVGRSRRSSLVEEARSRMSSLSSNSSGTEQTPGFISSEAVLEALGAVKEEVERSKTHKHSWPKKKNSLFRSRRSSVTKSKTEDSDRTGTPMEYIIPGKGILPSEVLNGIQGLAFGADGFCHGLPKESRPRLSSLIAPTSAVSEDQGPCA